MVGTYTKMDEVIDAIAAAIDDGVEVDTAITQVLENYPELSRREVLDYFEEEYRCTPAKYAENAVDDKEWEATQPGIVEIPEIIDDDFMGDDFFPDEFQGGFDEYDS